MEFLFPVLSLLIGLINFILVLRVWLEFCRVSPSLPISQTLMRLTNPMLQPLGKFIPYVRHINMAALTLAVVLVTLLFIFFGIDLPQAALIGVLSVLKSFGQILFFTTAIRAISSWFSQGNHPMEYTLAQITEPVLGVIRRVLPRTGMIDFSVMVLGFALLLLNSFFYKIFGQLWALA